MIGRDQRKYAESPKHQRVSDSRQWPLGNHFSLQHYFPNKIGHAAGHRLDAKIGVWLGLADDPPHFSESQPEADNGSRQQNKEQGRLRPGQLGHQLRV
jgi:hypothetical protein